MDIMEFLIWGMVAAPPAIVALLSYYWIKTRSKPAVLYWNGEYLKHINVDPDNTGTFNIGNETHVIKDVTPVLFKARILGVKQFTYFVHHDKLKAMSLLDFLNENDAAFKSDLPPESMKILLEGADIKATHQSLESLKFNWKNPMLLAGIGIGLAVGVVAVLVFYNPTIPVQVVEAPAKAAQAAGVAKVAGFLVF